MKKQEERKGRRALRVLTHFFLLEGFEFLGEVREEVDDGGRVAGHAGFQHVGSVVLVAQQLRLLGAKSDQLVEDLAVLFGTTEKQRRRKHRNRKEWRITEKGSQNKGRRSE
jgi:hypothetical protein